ncbi:HAD family hydrolase [Pseudactinotalea terrae]|uniref:HAD family hydrolase n=1 Tax=Pseudactinotalea terrae TaxID=1743262 RepID=UPI0012E11F9A|nr:HAD family hydrolase [Pseudactinotalea terrae]
MSAPTIRGVLFDVDDTLVDTASAFSAALTAAMAGLAPLSDEDAERVLATWRADAGGHYRAFVAGELTIVQQRRNRVDELTQLLGLATLDDDAFRVWDTDYQERFAAAWALFDDARACVEQAVDAGLAIGVVTNAPGEMQRAKIAAVGLSDLLTHLVAVDTFGVGKPDRTIFHEGCRLLGTVPEETIYVGDELDVDAGGAVEAGLAGVWLDRPGRRRGGPHAVTEERLATARAAGVEVVTSLTELPELWQERVDTGE